MYQRRGSERRRRHPVKSVSRARIVLSNSYGTANVGDEAILTVLVDELTSRDFAVDILSLTPEDTARRHPQAIAVRSRVLSGALATYRVIRKADALVVGGGGILQDATSLGNLLLHVSRPMMAAFSSTPYAIAGVGVGPLRRSVSRFLTRRVCQSAAYIDVRDKGSARLLADIGVTPEAVRVGADLAHLLPADGPDALSDQARGLRESLVHYRDSGRPLIGLSLRPAVGAAARRSHLSREDKDLLVAMADLADRLVEQHDAQIVFVSMHPQQDDWIASLVAQWMKHEDRMLVLPGALEPGTVKALIAELDVVIGMRLHTLIFAAAQAVPMVALAYDAKVAAYAESLGLDAQVLRRDAWSAPSILEAVQRSLDKAGEIRVALRKAVSHHENAARASIDKICAIARREC